MLPTSLQSHLPVPQDFIKLFWFSFVVAAVAFSSTFPPPKTSGKAAITFFQGLLFITALLPFIFCSLCASLRVPPVPSLIFTVCWGEKCFSIYWHIYFMCFAAHRVIKHCLSHSNNVNVIWHQISHATPPRLLLLARCTKQFAVAQMHNAMILEYISWLSQPPSFSLLQEVAWLPWTLKSWGAQCSLPPYCGQPGELQSRATSIPPFSLWRNTVYSLERQEQRRMRREKAH